MAQPKVVFDGRVLRLGHEGLAVHLSLWIGALATHWGASAVRVLLPDDVRANAPAIPPQSVHWVHASHARGFVWRDFRNAYRIARERERHYPGAWFLVSAPWYAGPVPRGTAVWLHDCIERHWPHARGSWGQQVLRALGERRMRRRASRVLAISHWARAEAIRWLGLKPERVEVVPNFVRPELARPVTAQQIAAVRERYRLPREYIAYLGGFRSYKGVETLTAAWSAARQTGNGTIPPLVLAGKIPTSAQGGYFTIRDRILGLAGAARTDLCLPGPIDDDDLAGFYAGAKLFVAPSAFEGFGFPLAEAMACGAPVIASAIPAYDELLPATARRFPAGNADAIQTALVEALMDPDRHRHPLPLWCSAAVSAARLEQVLEAIGASHAKNRAEWAGFPR